MQRIKSVIGAAVAASATVVLVAGAPALAASSSKPVTGPEVVFGAVKGKAATVNAPTIPLSLTGVVGATSVIHLGNGKGKHKALHTTAGILAVTLTGKPQTKSHANPKSCRERFNQYLTLTVDGARSTGKFAGASGPGAVKVHFAGFGPRYHSGPKKGQCNFKSNRVRNKGARASFLLSSVLTVK